MNDFCAGGGKLTGDLHAGVGVGMSPGLDRNMATNGSPSRGRVGGLTRPVRHGQPRKQPDLPSQLGKLEPVVAFNG